MLLLVATLIFKYNTGVYFLVQAGVCISKLLLLHSTGPGMQSSIPVLSVSHLIDSVTCMCFYSYLLGPHI